MLLTFCNCFINLQLLSISELEKINYYFWVIGKIFIHLQTDFGG